MRETPTSRVYAQEPSEWCGPSQHILLVQRGWKARKIPAMGRIFFYAFDLLWLDGTDLRGLALSGRKALLRKLLPRKAHAVRYVEHVASGTDVFRVICDRDMERDCREAGERQVHARGNDVGEDQEPDGAGINRLGVANERVVQRRTSEPLWPRAMRGRP